MLSSEIARIVIFEVNLDQPAPVSPLNYHGPKLNCYFFCPCYFAREYLFVCLLFIYIYICYLFILLPIYTCI